MPRFKEREEKRGEEIILNDCLFVLPRVCAGINQEENTRGKNLQKWRNAFEFNIHVYMKLSTDYATENIIEWACGKQFTLSQFFDIYTILKYMNQPYKNPPLIFHQNSLNEKRNTFEKLMLIKLKILLLVDKRLIKIKFFKLNLN